MKIEFDPAKNDRNVALRQLSFDRAIDFDFESAQYSIDLRKNYGEIRIQAIGYLEQRVHLLVFVEIPGGIRVISFRKANSREVKLYESQT